MVLWKVNSSRQRTSLANNTNNISLDPVLMRITTHSSDRSIHRSDTILTHQPSHSPSAFSQPQPQPHPQSHSQSTRDRNASSSSSHTQSNIRSSLSNLHPSSSISAQNSVPSTYSSSYQIFR